MGTSPRPHSETQTFRPHSETQTFRPPTNIQTAVALTLRLDCVCCFGLREAVLQPAHTITIHGAFFTVEAADALEAPVFSPTDYPPIADGLPHISVHFVASCICGVLLD